MYDATQRTIRTVGIRARQNCETETPGNSVPSCVIAPAVRKYSTCNLPALQIELVETPPLAPVDARLESFQRIDVRDLIAPLFVVPQDCQVASKRRGIHSTSTSGLLACLRVFA